MKGFTLVELLIVIAILVIMLSMGVPTFKTIQPDLKLSGDIRDLTGDLRLACRMSVTEQVSYGILFSEKKYDLVLFGENKEVLKILKTKQLNSGINFKSITFTNNKVLFNSYGSVNEGGSVILENSKQRIKTIQVSPAGFVKVEN